MHGIHNFHDFPGKLIVFEGIDGSGKSTQAALITKWLQSRGVPIHFTEWNSSMLVKGATKAAKKKASLTPTTFSLLHATDFADRLTYRIIPPLKAGMVVIADRYAFTAFARDCARGVDPTWVRALYNFAFKPDLSLYFKVPVSVSLERLLSSRAKIKYYEAGMDTGLSKDPEECFMLFQQRVVDRYNDMTSEFGFHTIDARTPIYTMQQHVREVVETALGDYLNDYPVVDEDDQESMEGGAYEASRILRARTTVR
jgi:dTMP kinase